MKFKTGTYHGESGFSYSGDSAQPQPIRERLTSILLEHDNNYDGASDEDTERAINKVLSLFESLVPEEVEQTKGKSWIAGSQWGWNAAVKQIRMNMKGGK